MNYGNDIASPDNNIGKGKISLIVGPPESGKTYTAIQLAADYHIPRNIVFVDFCHSFSNQDLMGTKFESNKENFVCLRPENIELAIRQLEVLLPNLESGVIIIDTLTAASPQNYSFIKPKGALLGQLKILNFLLPYVYDGIDLVVVEHELSQGQAPISSLFTKNIYKLQERRL